MLDLFKLSKQEVDEVHKSLLSHVKNHKLKVGIEALDNLPKGWLPYLVARFEDISMLNIHIDMMNCEFGRLEIHMNCNKTNKLAKSLLWKQRVEQESVGFCMGCGDYIAKRQIFQGKVYVICNNCKQAVKDSGITGTWLDKY